jgi:hypothetical protein
VKRVTHSWHQKREVFVEITRRLPAQKLRVATGASMRVESTFDRSAGGGKELGNGSVVPAGGAVVVTAATEKSRGKLKAARSITGSGTSLEGSYAAGFLSKEAVQEEPSCQSSAHILSQNACIQEPVEEQNNPSSRRFEFPSRVPSKQKMPPRREHSIAATAERSESSEPVRCIAG